MRGAHNNLSITFGPILRFLILVPLFTLCSPVPSVVKVPC